MGPVFPTVPAASVYGGRFNTAYGMISSGQAGDLAILENPAVKGNFVQGAVGKSPGIGVRAQSPGAGGGCFFRRDRACQNPVDEKPGSRTVEGPRQVIPGIFLNGGIADSGVNLPAAGPERPFSPLQHQGVAFPAAEVPGDVVLRFRQEIVDFYVGAEGKVLGPEQIITGHVDEIIKAVKVVAPAPDSFAGPMGSPHDGAAKTVHAMVRSIISEGPVADQAAGDVVLAN